MARARLTWTAHEEHHETQWLEGVFLVADESQCDAEPRDRAGLHWIGRHHAARTQRLASDAARDGNDRKAVAILKTAIRRLGRYATGDPELERLVGKLQALESEIKAGRLTANARRELRYQSMVSSRGQRDHRGQR